MIDPTQPLSSVFPSNLIDSWLKDSNISQELRFRVNILTAGDVSFNRPLSINFQKMLRARRAAWETYLIAAQAVGIFDGSSGRDLLARLRSPKSENFRGAMGECMAAWVLAGPLHHIVSGRGRAASSVPDLGFSYEGLGIQAEVKSPYREIVGNFFRGDDSDAIQTCVSEACSQFDQSSTNLLIVTPQLRTPILSDRYQLIKALIAEEVIEVPVSCSSESQNEEDQSRTTFRLNGRFTKPLKKDRGPGFTRIGALMSIEERIVSADDHPFDKLYRLQECFVAHSLYVVHNPFAANPVPMKAFQGIPQFIKLDAEGTMGWTDGHFPGPY